MSAVKSRSCWSLKSSAVQVIPSVYKFFCGKHGEKNMLIDAGVLVYVLFNKEAIEIRILFLQTHWAKHGKTFTTICMLIWILWSCSALNGQVLLNCLQFVFMALTFTSRRLLFTHTHTNYKYVGAKFAVVVFGILLTCWQPFESVAVTITFDPPSQVQMHWSREVKSTLARASWLPTVSQCEPTGHDMTHCTNKPTRPTRDKPIATKRKRQTMQWMAMPSFIRSHNVWLIWARLDSRQGLASLSWLWSPVESNTQNRNAKLYIVFPQAAPKQGV